MFFTGLPSGSNGGTPVTTAIFVAVVLFTIAASVAFFLFLIYVAGQIGR